MARKSRKTSRIPEPIITPEFPVIEGTGTIPTAAYGRLSVENSGKETDESLQTQMEIVYNYIGEHPELSLVDSYMDNGYTGTNFARPGFQRLMNDINSGRIGCIVVKDLSRFGRDYLETGYLLETLLPKLGVRFIAVNDQYDSFNSGDEDVLTIPIKNIVNSMYAKDQSRKMTIAASVRRHKSDAIPNGSAPYGYVISEDKSQYLPDPESSKYVKAIFQWARMGLTFDQIANRLNLMDVPTPSDYRRLKLGAPSKGKQWAYSTIHTIIHNPSYVGDVCLGRIRQCMYKAEPVRRTSKDEWVIREDAHAPLVTKEDYKQIMERVQEENCYSARSKSYNVKAREIFRDQMKGLVYCAECGCRMNYILFRNDYSRPTEEELEKGLRSKKNGLGRVEYYICPPLAGKAKCGGHQINVNLLKIVVMDQINFQLRAMNDMGVVLNKLKEQNGGKDPVLSVQRKIASMDAKLEDAKNTIMKLYVDLSENVISEDEYNMIRSDLLLKKTNIEREREYLIGEYQRQQRLISRFTGVLQNVDGEECSNEFDENLVEKMIERITVSADGDIEVRFKFSDTVERAIELLKGEMQS